MNLTFREATEADIPVIYQLADKIWHEHYPDVITVEQIDFMLRTRYAPNVMQQQIQNGERFFIAYEGATPVAYASVELKGDSYFLHKFYVDVSLHRNGAGSQFFNYLRTQINAGIPIRLQVNRQNYKAVNFYFKKGFVIETVGDFDIGGGYYMNDFIMLRK
jgi:GNAT superfamily N-acetyltransferase